jgi:hypothetical protein
MDKMIRGLFRLESDRDGGYYKVIFRPERRQSWSVEPDGFIIVFSDLDRHDRTMELIGEHREPWLSQARVDGVVEFHGEVSCELYERCAWSSVQK